MNKNDYENFECDVRKLLQDEQVYHAKINEVIEAYRTPTIYRNSIAKELGFYKAPIIDIVKYFVSYCKDNNLIIMPSSSNLHTESMYVKYMPEKHEKFMQNAIKEMEHIILMHK